MGYRTVLVLILLAAITTYSQKVIHKDAYNIGGGVSFSITEKDHPEFSSTSHSFVFNPSLTYHILDVFTIGGNFSFVYAEEKIEDENGSQKSVEMILEIGPKTRYYLHDENLSPFLEASVNYSHVLPAKTEGFSFTIGTGINYFISKSVALEPAVSYTSSSYSNPEYDSKSFRVGINVNYHINE